MYAVLITSDEALGKDLTARSLHGPFRSQTRAREFMNSLRARNYLDDISLIELRAPTLKAVQTIHGGPFRSDRDG